MRFGAQRPNSPPLMPGWHDYPVAQRLTQLLGIPAYLARHLVIDKVFSAEAVDARLAAAG